MSAREKYAAVAVALLCLASCRAAPPDRYVAVRSATQLPRDVHARLSETVGKIAEQGEPYNDTCVVGDARPRARFIAAAVSRRSAVIVYESGGFAHMENVIVFDRTSKKKGPSLRGWFSKEVESAEFLPMLNDGTLWTRVKLIGKNDA